MRWLALSFVVILAACSSPPPPAVSAPQTASASTAAPKPKEAAPPITVGVLLPLSGADGIFGVEARDGIELARDEVNAAGGVHETHIHLSYADDHSVALQAADGVRRLIEREEVIAVLGEITSSRTLAAGLLANHLKTPLITPTATNVELTRDRPYVFRATFNDALQGAIAARFVHHDLGKKRVAVVRTDGDAYSTALSSSFRQAFTEAGGTIVLDVALVKDADSSKDLVKLRNAKPEMVFAPLYYSDMARLARQAQAAGISGSMFFGADGWDSEELVQRAGGDLDGAMFVNHFAADAPWPATEVFVKAFAARYKHPPSVISASAYDAAKMLFSAIGRASVVSREAVRGALAEVRAFEGATGTMSMTTGNEVEFSSVPILRVGKENVVFFKGAEARR